MRIIKTSNNGINFIIKNEGGAYLKSYKCPANIWTISVGCTFYEDGSRVKQGDIITKEKSDALFKFILKQYEQSVDSFTRDDINQNQFDSLVDFAYNAGVAALKSSTLLKKVNANPNDPTIKNEFLKWIYGGDGTKNKRDDDGDGLVDEAGEKQRLAGLLARREAEAELYFRK